LCDVVSWQLGLVEREINQLLQSDLIQQTARSQPTLLADKQNSAEDASGTVPQREVSEDDVCPICQEELLAKHQPVTFCRSDCVIAADVNMSDCVCSTLLMLGGYEQLWH